MKLKHTIILPALGLALATGAQAAAGFFGSFINITTNGSAAWQAMGTFNGSSLGTFDKSAGQTLAITGGEGLTWESDGDEVTSVAMQYSIQPTGGTHSHTALNLKQTAEGSFSDALGQSYTSPGGSWNTKWSDPSDWGSVDVLDGLSNGTYELQVYLTGDGDAGPIVEDNGGAYYTATFTVVPEPSSAALLGLGGLALILRRRK